MQNTHDENFLKITLSIRLSKFYAVDFRFNRRLEEEPSWKQKNHSKHLKIIPNLLKKSMLLDLKLPGVNLIFLYFSFF